MCIYVCNMHVYLDGLGYDHVDCLGSSCVVMFACSSLRDGETDGTPGRESGGFSCPCGVHFGNLEVSIHGGF